MTLKTCTLTHEMICRASRCSALLVCFVWFLFVGRGEGFGVPAVLTCGWACTQGSGSRGGGLLEDSNPLPPMMEMLTRSPAAVQGGERNFHVQVTGLNLFKNLFLANHGQSYCHIIKFLNQVITSLGYNVNNYRASGKYFLCISRRFTFLLEIIWGSYYIQISHDIEFGKTNYSPLCFKEEMNCVYDSEIIFRHMKVIHRKYSRWL